MKLHTASNQPVVTSTLRHVFTIAMVLAIPFVGFKMVRDAGQAAPAVLGARHAEAPAPALLQAPLSFEPNVGQAPDATRYLSRGPGYALHMDPDAARLHLGNPDREQPSTVALRWLGGRAAPPLGPVDKLDGTVSYLHGRDQSAWLRDVPTYRKVAYRDVYPGIDLVFYGNPQRLEYDLVVAAGAKPESIRLQFDGVDRAEVETATGDLLMRIGDRTIRQHAPIAYQDQGAQRVSVPVRYDVAVDGAVSFALGAFDAGQALVIDPVVDWSTFLGGSSVEYATSVALNSKGDVIVSGSVNSSSWPLAPGQPRRGESDAFVSRFSSSGQHQYTVFFGGDGGDMVADIAIDRFDNIYLTGTTTSLDYPTTAGAAMEESASLKVAFRVGLPFLRLGELSRDTAPTGDADAFMTKLDSSARNFLYSTYLSGSPELALKLGSKLTNPTKYGLTFEFNPGTDEGTAIAVDDHGNAYVVGKTLADTFPATANAFKSELNGFFGAADGFLSKINTNRTGLASLEFSSYIGGSCHDEITDIAVDHVERVYLTGTSDIAIVCGGFATTPGAAHYDRIGQQDAFVMKLVLNETPGAIYSTFIGSGARDYGGRIGFDHDGNAYATYHQEVTFGGSDPMVGMVSLSADGKSERWKQQLNFTKGNLPGATGGEVRPHALFSSTDGLSTRMFLVLNTLHEGTRLYTFPDLSLPISDHTPLNFPTGSTALSAAANARRLYVAGVTTSASFPMTNAAQSTKGAGTDGFVVGYTHAMPPVLTPLPAVTRVEGESTVIDLIQYTRSAGTNTTFDVNISWGDGLSGFTRTSAGASGTINAAHAYQDNGTFKGQVCLSEESATEEPAVCGAFTVNVTNVAPTLTITNPTVTGTTPGAVFFSNGTGLSLRLATIATITDPGGNDTHTATIEWTPFDLAEPLEVAPATRNIVDGTHTYVHFLGEASQVARICVTDDDGAAAACQSMTVKLPVADLRIEKFGPPTVAECSAVDYRVKVTNHGPDAASNVTIRDMLPDAAHMSYLNAIAMGGGADGTVVNAQTLSVGGGNFNFSTGVAVEGDTAVITDGDGPHVYKRNPANFKWDRISRLDTANDHFVAIRGDWLAVSREGFNTDPTTTVAGSVALFKKVGGAWPSVPAQTLGPSGAHKVYGNAVAIGDDFLAVGDKSANGGDGRVHLYRRENDAWILDQVLQPPATAIAGSNFGAAVALSPNGRVLAVGAPLESAILPAEGGVAFVSGSVLIYTRGTTAWTLDQRLVPSNASLSRPQQFGYSVALNEDNSQTTLVVGAPSDPGNSGNLQNFAGRAFVFKRITAAWVEMASFTPNDAAPNAHFGRAVDISGSRILVGTGQPLFTAGANANQDRAYLFGYDGALGVSQLLRLRPTAVQSLDGFGMTLALSGADMIVGAPRGHMGRAYAFSSCGQPSGADTLECNVGSLASGQSAEFLLSLRIGNGITSGSPKTLSFDARALGGGLDTNGALAGVSTVITNGACGTTITDVTAPVILPKVTGGIAGRNGWYQGGDIKVEWTIADAESAIISQSACTTETVSADTNGTTFSCTATSSGGASSNSITIKRDSVAPAINASVDAGSGNKLVFACEDPLSNGAASGIGLGCPSGLFPSPGSVVSRVVEDLAGHKTPIVVTLPFANASLDQRVNAGNGCAANVALDGSGSITGAAPFSYSWRNGGAPVATGVAPTVLLDAGTHEIDLVVTSATGITHSDRVTVTVVDDIPPVLTNVPAAVTVDATGHRTQVPLGLPAASDACMVTLTSSAPEDGFLSGATTVLFRATDTYGNETTAATVVTVTPKVNVGATLNPATIAAGGKSLVTVTLTNQGPSRATDIAIVPDLPDGFAAVKIATGTERCVADSAGNPACTPVLVYTQDAACVESEDGLACVMPGLDAGETRTFSLMLAASVGASGAAPVSFTTSPSQSDTDAANNIATGELTVIRVADLGVTISGPSSGVAGLAATYTATVTNAGPASSLGSTLIFSKNGHTAGMLPAACVDKISAVVCAVGGLAPGASTQVAVDLVIAPAAVNPALVNTIVDGAETDPIRDNDFAIHTVNTIDRRVDVSLSIAPIGPVVAGQVLTWDVRLLNHGPSTASSTLVVTGWPEAGSTPAGCARTAEALSCPVMSVGPGSVRSLLLTLPLAADARGTALLSATVTTTDSDTNPANNTATASAAIEARADLGVTLAAPAEAVAGRAAAFTATITNHGPSSAGAIVVHLPGEERTITPLASGQSATVAFDRGVEPFARGSFDTTVSIGSDDVDPVAANNTALAQVPVKTETDLLVTMTAAPAPVKAGQTVTYRITVTNNGPSGATAIEVAHALPAGVTLEGANDCAHVGAIITCAIDRLDPQASSARSIIVKVAASTRDTLTSTVDVSGAEADPDPASNHFALVTGVESGSDLQVSVTARPAALVPGQTFVYAIEIVNAGPATAIGLSLTHRLPPGIASGALPDGCTIAAAVITCTIDALDLAATETIELLATPAVAGSHTAVSSLTSASDETDASNNTALTVILAGSPAAGPVAAGDFDGDGDLDVAVADEREDRVQIYLNKNGRLDLTDRVRVGRRPEALAVGDLDGDGDLDIVTVNRQSSSISIVENNGRGDFHEDSRPDLRGDSPVAVVVGDFTGDGQLDIVAALRDGDGLALVTRGDDGRWREEGTDPRRRSFLRWCRILERPSAMAAGDFDGDGDLDLVLIERRGRSIGILTNDGGGRFTDGDEIRVHQSRQHDDVAVGDFDGDGDLDLAVTGLSHNRMTLVINEGLGRLRARTTTTEVGRRPEAIAAGDFDGDGALDVATANSNEDSVSVLRNMNGSFPASSVAEIDTMRRPIAVLTGDFNGDGKLDVVIVSEKGYVPQLILNR